MSLGRRTTLMPFGAVVAVANVTGCHSGDLETVFGDGNGGLRPPCSPWAIPGQWHIELADVRPLPEPVPAKGALGLWRLPEDVEKAVREQLSEVTR